MSIVLIGDLSAAACETWRGLWAGVDRLLGDPALPENITVARLIDPAMAQSMAEGAVATTMFVHRQLPATSAPRYDHCLLLGRLRSARRVGGGLYPPQSPTPDAGDLGHAVLDVFQQEPLPAHHPFWMHPQITVLPHVAATTDPATAAPIAMRNVVAFRAGRPLTGVVSRSLGY